MRLLGIDYGRRKIGLALSTDKLAEPYSVIRYVKFEEGIRRVGQVVKVEQVEKVIVGISEGKIAEETRDFGKALRGATGVKVVYQDETLTTQNAQELSLQAGLKRNKRKKLEDAYAATLILQSYLDSHP